jgi:membrane protease YdiL (CAAX protease family)
MIIGSVSDPTPPPVGPSAAPAQAMPAWRLVVLACGWYALAMVGAVVFGAIAGAVVGIVGGRSAVHAPDGKAVIGSIAQFGTALVLFGSALNRGEVIGGGNLRAGLGDAPISRPVLMIALGIAAAIYAALLDFGIYRARPDLNVSVGAWTLVLSAVMTVAVSPIAEELFFRGWLWTGLQKHWGALSTSTLTGALWLVVHLEQGLVRPVLLLPMAVVLSAARHLGRSVRAPIALHVCYNLVAVLARIALIKTGLI